MLETRPNRQHVKNQRRRVGCVCDPRTAAPRCLEAYSRSAREMNLQLFPAVNLGAFAPPRPRERRRNINFPPGSTPPGSPAFHKLNPQKLAGRGITPAALKYFGRGVSIAGSAGPRIVSLSSGHPPTLVPAPRPFLWRESPCTAQTVALKRQRVGGKPWVSPTAWRNLKAGGVEVQAIAH